MKHQFPIQESRTVEISTVNKNIDCNNSYYIIIGKLIVGPGEVKTIDVNRRVKEDIISIDKTGQAGLPILGKLIEGVSNGNTYDLSHPENSGVRNMSQQHRFLHLALLKRWMF